MEDLKKKYQELKEKKLQLDMSRGKPSADVLDLSNNLLRMEVPAFSESGIDLRNYGELSGIPESKKLFSDILDIPVENIFVGGNSSLSHIYNAFNVLYNIGISNHKPWKEQGKVKFLCPVPGYDRHFSILEKLNIEMIKVPMKNDGPDMDIVESLASSDDMIKGIICIPLYHNPTGIVYSEEVLKRLAGLSAAAEDFRIFLDNAYGVHHLWAENKIPNFFNICNEAGHPDRLIYFFSTSKMTFPGAGISMFAAHEEVYNELQKYISIQTIGFDKVNQKRAVDFLKNAEHAKKHMAKIAEILRPKFDICIDFLERELKDKGLIDFENPKGGYFISIDILKGKASEVIKIASELGVKLTPAGATFPYGDDPKDSNIRIAPTYPPIPELKDSLEVLKTAVLLASFEG